MKNGNVLINLFQGMFENNLITFNPSWDKNANKLNSFDDVRAIQKELKTKGLNKEVDKTTSSPASIVVKDPDDNIVLIDQHV